MPLFFFFFHRNISDKRLPREACSDQGDVEVERDTAMKKEEGEDALVEKGPQ